MQTHHDRLNTILRIYRDAMRRHIKEIISDDPPDGDPANDWYTRKVLPILDPDTQQKIHSQRGEYSVDAEPWLGESQLDIPQFERIVTEIRGFDALGKPPCTEWMREVQNLRNLWAHPPIGGCTWQHTEQAARLCGDLLAQFDESAATEIRQLSRDSTMQETDAIMAQLDDVLNGVQSLLDQRVQRELITEILTISAQSNERLQPLAQRLDALESEQRAERESRERQLGEIAETLERLLEAQSEPRPPLVDEILGAERVESLKQSLRRLQGG